MIIFPFILAEEKDLERVQGLKTTFELYCISAHYSNLDIIRLFSLLLFSPLFLLPLLLIIIFKIILILLLSVHGKLYISIYIQIYSVWGFFLLFCTIHRSAKMATFKPFQKTRISKHLANVL